MTQGGGVTLNGVFNCCHWVECCKEYYSSCNWIEIAFSSRLHISQLFISPSSIVVSLKHAGFSVFSCTVTPYNGSRIFKFSLEMIYSLELTRSVVDYYSIVKYMILQLLKFSNIHCDATLSRQLHYSVFTFT